MHDDVKCKSGREGRTGRWWTWLLAGVLVPAALCACLTSCAPPSHLGAGEPADDLSPDFAHVGEQNDRDSSSPDDSPASPESGNEAQPSERSEEGAGANEQAQAEAETDSSSSAEQAEPPRRRVYAPLTWDIGNAFIVGRQGTTALWGACGECCIANTLNLVTGSSYTEADIVGYVLERGLCDPTTGGMTLENIADAYVGLIPLDAMGAYGYGGDYAPSIDDMARLLDKGIILNAAVYGEMMREGGHTGEGDVYTTHWIVLHSVERNPDGSVAGFGIVDSASSISYLSAQQLADIYYGHDGTSIIDPSCVLVYRWVYADER